ncbi:MAG TPA: NUDIX domain-containing protein [Planctomycetota bacterium]|nr:NUDIX domain-containing protein [Planctomycetota bacterium]
MELWRRRRLATLRVPLWPAALARVPGFGGRDDVDAILGLLPPLRRVRILDGVPVGALAALDPERWTAVAPLYERALRDLARERRWEPIEVADAFLLQGGRILLDFRPRTANCYAGLWDTPGGKLEPGEDLGEALGRELEEELGVSPGRATVLGRIDHRDPTSGRVFRHSICLVRRWNGRPRACEGQTLRWFAIREVLALRRLNPVVRRAVDADLRRSAAVAGLPRSEGAAPRSPPGEADSSE